MEDKDFNFDNFIEKIKRIEEENTRMNEMLEMKDHMYPRRKSKYRRLFDRLHQGFTDSFKCR